MNLFDFAMVGVVILFAVYGMNIGFFRSVISIVSYTLAAVVAKIAQEPLAQAIYTRFIQGIIINKMNSLLPASITSGDLSKVVSGLNDSIPEIAAKLADYFHLLPTEESLQKLGDALTVQGLEQTYVQPMVIKVLAFVAGMALFFVSLIVFRLVLNTLNRMIFSKKHKLLSTTNKILGFFVGMIRGAVPALILCALALLVIPLTGNQTLMSIVSGSYFCTLITNLIM